MSQLLLCICMIKPLSWNPSSVGGKKSLPPYILSFGCQIRRNHLWKNNTALCHPSGTRGQDRSLCRISSSCPVPTGVITEHMAVRESCGLFDVSHMGEILCEGPGALKLLNHLLTNDFTNMYDGQARYSLMCYENGCCVDDLIVYKVRDEHYFYRSERSQQG